MFACVGPISTDKQQLTQAVQRRSSSGTQLQTRCCDSELLEAFAADVGVSVRAVRDWRSSPCFLAQGRLLKASLFSTVKWGESFYYKVAEDCFPLCPLVLPQLNGLLLQVCPYRDDDGSRLAEQGKHRRGDVLRQATVPLSNLIYSGQLVIEKSKYHLLFTHKSCQLDA